MSLYVNIEKSLNCLNDNNLTFMFIYVKGANTWIYLLQQNKVEATWILLEEGRGVSTTKEKENTINSFRNLFQEEEGEKKNK